MIGTIATVLPSVEQHGTGGQKVLTATTQPLSTDMSHLSSTIHPKGNRHQLTGESAELRFNTGAQRRQWSRHERVANAGMTPRRASSRCVISDQLNKPLRWWTVNGNHGNGSQDQLERISRITTQGGCTSRARLLASFEVLTVF